MNAKLAKNIVSSILIIYFTLILIRFVYAFFYEHNLMELLKDPQYALFAFVFTAPLKFPFWFLLAGFVWFVVIPVLWNLFVLIFEKIKLIVLFLYQKIPTFFKFLWRKLKEQRNPTKL